MRERPWFGAPVFISMNYYPDRPPPSRQGRQSFREVFFLLAAVPLAMFIGCGGNQSANNKTQADQHAAAIREVLAQDKKAGEKCTEEVNGDRLAAVRTYCLTLRRIDLRRCPPDFQEAFLKHRYAWEEVIPFLEKYDGFTGDLISLFEIGSAIISNQSLTTDKDREFERIRKTISATYFEVERTALRYGVQVDH